MEDDVKVDISTKSKFVVFECVQLKAEQTSLTWEERGHILKDTCRGLAYLHAGQHPGLFTRISRHKL